MTRDKGARRATSVFSLLLTLSLSLFLSVLQRDLFFFFSVASPRHGHFSFFSRSDDPVATLATRVPAPRYATRNRSKAGNVQFSDAGESQLSSPKAELHRPRLRFFFPPLLLPPFPLTYSRSANHGTRVFSRWQISVFFLLFSLLSFFFSFFLMFRTDRDTFLGFISHF